MDCAVTIVTWPLAASSNIDKIFGAKGLRSTKRLDKTCRTMTVISNFGRFCSKDRLRSTVIKTSNSAVARIRS